MDNKRHIKFDGHFENLTYKYPKDVVITDKSVLLIKEWATHGNYLLTKTNEIKEFLGTSHNLDSSLISEEIVYVEFTSDWGCEL